ncbi:uncharacterized protein LOC143861707 [Tasmannia lanceolata]|uniref:uncharacterized protein LOC143861707 n=1 Tax=Tasmannia lanceolata TaxID=3420 RepID=UPI0040645BB2
MEKVGESKRKGSKLGNFLKTLSRRASISTSNNRSSGLPFVHMSKSKSWPPAANSEEDKRCQKRQVCPVGCFSVYVGPEKQRFVIKTEYVNHPLFKMLLEEAELEYGYNSEGPLALPCKVDLFYKVLCEMDNDEVPQGCSFPKGYSAYQLLSPSRVSLN